MRRFVVLDEHTLGVIYPNGIQVLRASIIRGGEAIERYFVYPMPDKSRLRPATMKDFDDYMVQRPTEAELLEEA